MRKLPRVAIIGYPNVGKSTLFNRLIGRRTALVHSLPGMTRDCLAGQASLAGKPAVLLDTGGFFGVKDEPLSAKIREKAWQAAESADLVLLVLDGKRDLSPGEEELYVSLKRLGRPLLVVVNKIDSPSQEDRLAEFYRLGDPAVFPVSAEHNLNLGILAEAAAAALPPAAEPEAAEGGKPLRIAIVGRINVGKSSIVNRLAGEEKLLVSELPGTTRDSTDTLILRGETPFCLVDTAGIRKFAGASDDREKAGIVRARVNIREADVICLVLDVTEFPTRQDAHIANLAQVSGKPLVIALNKWDLADGPRVDPEAVRKRILSKLQFVDYAPLLFISARTGQRVVKILDLAEQAYRSASLRIDTAKLNAFLSELGEEASVRLKTGERVRIKYMTQIGTLPPTFLLFGRAPAPLSAASERHWGGLLRRRFGFEGTPIRVFLRKS